MRRLAVLPMLLFPLCAAANCKDNLQAWASAVRADLKFDSEHAVCRINPADSRQVLAVIIANASTGQIIDRHYKAAPTPSTARS